MKNVKIALMALLALTASSCLEAKEKTGTVTYTAKNGQTVTKSCIYRNFRKHYRSNPQYPNATYHTKQGKRKKR